MESGSTSWDLFARRSDQLATTGDLRDKNAARIEESEDNVMDYSEEGDLYNPLLDEEDRVNGRLEATGTRQIEQMEFQTSGEEINE